MAAARKLGLGALFGGAWYLALLASPSNRDVMSGEAWFPWPVMLALLIALSAQLSVLVPAVRSGRRRWMLALLMGPCFAVLGAALYAEALLSVDTVRQVPWAVSDGSLFDLFAVWLLGLLFTPLVACATVLQGLPWIVALSGAQVAVLSRRRA